MHRKPANFYPKSRVIRSQFSQPSSQVGVACRVDGRHKDLVEVKARRRSKWLADGKWQTLIKHGTQQLLTRDLGSSKNRVPKIPWLLFMFPCVYLYIYIYVPYSTCHFWGISHLWTSAPPWDPPRRSNGLAPNQSRNPQTPWIHRSKRWVVD